MWICYIFYLLVILINVIQCIYPALYICLKKNNDKIPTKDLNIIIGYIIIGLILNFIGIFKNFEYLYKRLYINNIKFVLYCLMNIICYIILMDFYYIKLNIEEPIYSYIACLQIFLYILIIPKVLNNSY